MEISLVFRVHPSEEVLEEYAFGRLSGDRLSTVEEHLLLCEACQQELDHTDRYIRLVKTAAAEPCRVPRRASLAGIRNTLQAARPASTATWIGVLASACLMVVILLPRGFSPLPAAVPLHSYRGGEILQGDEAAMNVAPGSRPLDFTIPLEEVPFKPAYRLEVVTDAGRVVWTGAAQPVTRELTAHLTRRLNAGLYWVRLYDQNSGLLSEFGLRVK